MIKRAHPILEFEGSASSIPWRNRIENNILGPRSVMATCRSCDTRHQTKVKHKHSKKTHLMALGTSIFGGIISGCIPYFVIREPSTKTYFLALIISLAGGISGCIPYFFSSSESVTHSCPACGTFIGTYRT
ncbi:uncharacterized protein LOC117783178 [Drosophila innubila]|uniref:uncharacterized protein LOC117783178 n=1 Tax=Drosophila innubila TaxID=198719 RepID=UPI00148BC75B|nr:uncharacterized protein LOC117783178 [Drosophila innubila]